VPFVWAENNIKADYLYVSGPVLYDPRTIVDEQVKAHRLDGLLLGLDHLIDEYPHLRISPSEVLEDARIREWTKAIHLAGRGHAALRVGDPKMESLLAKLAQTPFRHPVRIVLDYSALSVLRYSFRQEVRLFQDTLDWVSDALGAG